MNVLIFIEFILLFGLSIALVYLYVLMMVYILPEKKLSPVEKPIKRFAIIIPAHNEEEVICMTLDSMRAIEYPPELFDVVVVADNCSDSTASIVIKNGFSCLERYNQEHRGKGYALEYAFNHLQPNGYDAFVVVDADSIVSSDFLMAMDRRLRHGQLVIQSCYGLSNSESSALTYLLYVGNILENNLFYAAKERLGLPILLRGNGMCFDRTIIAQHPWRAYSIVEDTEYGLNLIRAGIPVHFATEAHVLAKQPENLRQAYTQRVRWASGNATLSKRFALRLMWQGIVGKRLHLVDAGFIFFVLSKPLLLLASFMSTVIGAFLTQYGAGDVWFNWALLLLLLQAIYLLVGIVMSGITFQHIQYLLKAPAIMIWFTYVTLLGLVGVKKDQWLRTERT